MPETAPSYRGLLREAPAFRRLWLGELISYLGDWFNTIAIYTAVQAISDNAQAVAAVMIAKTLPAFLISPITGPIIDRFERRKILLLTDVARFFCVLGLIVAHRAQSLTGLYAFTILMMLFSGFVLPTKNAVLPMLLEKSKLPVANALSGGTWSIMLALGSALGGAAVSLIGITASLAIDGATFVISALLFLGLPQLPPPNDKADAQNTGFIEGVKYLLRTPYVLALASLKPLMGLSVGAASLIPIWSKRLAPENVPLILGLIMAARGLGSLTGSMVLRMLIGDAINTMRFAILFGFALIGAGYAVVATWDTLPLITSGYFLSAVGGGLIWVFSGTLLQGEGDPKYHGRVFSLEFGVLTLNISISSWVVAYLVDLGWTLHQGVLACGAVSLLAMVVWAAVLVRGPRT